MKYIFFTCMIFSQLTTVFAQEWNPKTAYWIYDAHFLASRGDVRVSYLRDTIVVGQNCQLLKKDIIQYNYWNKTYSYRVLDYEVTFYKDGVTYIRNNNRFDTLYYFSAKINDRYGVTSRLHERATDSAYAQVEDTGSVVVNAKKLKWMAVDYNFKVSTHHYTLRDTIIETIGATKYYFLPWDFVNGMLDGNQGGSLKCFHDSTLGIYNTKNSTDCKFDFNLLAPQSYEPYIKEIKQWKYVKEVYLTGGSGNESIHFVNLFYFKGDTIIDNVKYKKLYKKEEQPFPQKTYLAYLMREDTVNQKVYVVDLPFKKTAMLYDFKLQQGDIINMYITGGLYFKRTVIKVDTILVANKKLKRIEFNGDITWIEGIGAITRAEIPSEGELLCVKESDLLLYLNPKFSDCNIIFPQDTWDGIHTIKSNEVSLFPNPVVNSSVVRVNSVNSERLRIEIYNYSGDLVKVDYFSKEYPIGSLHLPRGLYVYRLVQNSQVVKVDKIIVVN